MYPRETRGQARSLYVHQRLSLSVISESVGVPTGTLSRWKSSAKRDGDDWDIARAAALVTGGGFEELTSEAVEGFVIMFQATMAQIRADEDMPPALKVKMMASLSDAFSKMVNAAGRASPQLSKLGVAADVLMRLGEFVRSNFPDHHVAFLEVLDAFVPEIGKAYHETS